MASMKYLLAVAIVATLASTAFAVKCYQCGSATNSKCGENFEAEENMKFDCSSLAAPSYLISLLTGRNANATGCMKQTVEAPLGGGTHILRSCYFGDIANTDGGCKLDPVKEVGMKLGSCNVCTGDLCNGSPSMAPAAVAILTFFSLARVFA